MFSETIQCNCLLLILYVTRESNLQICRFLWILCRMLRKRIQKMNENYFKLTASRKIFMPSKCSNLAEARTCFYEKMKSMCPPTYYHNCYVAIHTLGYWVDYFRICCQEMHASVLSVYSIVQKSWPPYLRHPFFYPTCPAFLKFLFPFTFFHSNPF